MRTCAFLAAVESLGRITGIGAAPHFLVTALLLLSACSVATIGHDTFPRLAVNNDAAVCPAFFQVVQKSYQSTDYYVSADDRPWPLADFEWIFSPKLINANINRDLDPTNITLRRAVDLDGDGKTELLVLLGYINGPRAAFSLVRHPTPQSFDDMTLAAGHSDLLGDGTDLLPNGEKGKSGTPSSNSNPPSVARIGNRYFLLWEGESYQDVFPPTLYRIPGSGLPEVVCKADLIADEKAPLGALEGTPVSTLYTQLVAMAGTDEKCSGTMQAVAVQAGSARITKWRVAARPWALHDGYNQRSRVDDWLAGWAHQGLWNYRVWRQFKETEPQALAALTDHYRRIFAFPDSEAQARQALDRVTTHHFLFPTHPRPDQRPGQSDLGWAVLEGAPDATVSRLIERTKWIISVDGSEATKREVFAQLNRALLLALEHPGAVRLLLEAGASADSKEPYGKTALMYAAQFDLLDTARLLVERGAEINSATLDVTSDDDSYCDSPEIAYRTALHYAAANASLPMIRMLVERGANPAATLDDKRAPADMIAANARLSPAEREAALALLRR
jgi:hypothetical protein